jgi:2-polyprenyl-3-methyl-5-hydroxy-6-metoxy-1,4-benzoquinol methylase
VSSLAASAAVPNATVPVCVLCGGESRVRYQGCRDFEYFVESSAPFHRCGACGLVFMQPLPRREELPTLYPATYNNFAAPSNPMSAFLLDRYLVHHAAVCRRLAPRGAVLEVGCGTGDLLDRLRTLGHRVRGVDVSPEACAIAARRGLDVFCGTLEELPTTERYELVFMSHVIEHVLDPLATVRAAATRLAPGGVLYLETPNVGSLDARLWGRHWGLIHYPRHLYLFDRSTLARLLALGGLERVRTAWEINSCGWAISIQGAARRAGLDRSRAPRSRYYPLLLLACLPLNLLDVCFGGTAFMSAVARTPA